jgi:hypothetical protein
LQAIERHAREKLAERNPDYTQEDVKRYIDSATNGYVGSDGILYFAKADSIAMDARAIIRGEQTTDIMATDKAVQSEFTPELEAKYQRWVRELLSVFKEPLIEVGRKKVEVNLVNLVDAMTRKATRGGEGGMTHASPGRVRSYLARKFKSIAEMHKFEDALVSEKQFHEWEESGDLETLAHTFAEDAMRHSRGSSGNEFIDYDRARNLLLEAARSRKISREGLRSIGSMYGYNLSDLGIEAGYQYLRTLSNAPTEYFEAKPQRAVYFDEFAGAVVPEGVDPKVIEILERRGIEYRTYPMRDNAARQAAVESFYDQPDVLFQRRRRDRVTVEPVTDPNARHGDMRIVGNVYWSEGRERRLIAYLPERYDVGEWRDSQRGRFRIVGLDPQDANYWIIELEGGGFTRFNPGETEANAINAPVGSVDAGNPNPPIAQASAEYARNTINPILDALERNIMTADRQPRSVPGAREMPERTQRMYRTWASKVQGQMSSAKLAATRMGEGYRDAALLNYTRKTNLDSMLEVIFPYQFWYTRTMLNWMGRFLDKPSILTNYYRFRQMQERHKRDGFPTRLEGKIGIPFPFLPEGMGDALYVDPMKQIFPWENFSRPLDKIADEQNTVEKKAVSILGRWAEERTYDPAAVQNALDTKKGELWEAALAEAKQSSELNYDDPLSLVSAVMTPSLPLYWAALALTGQEDKISQLPFTRMVQAMTGLAGVGEPGGVNLEKGIRQTLDMPEVDRWQDYRIDRELANMAADGRITPEEAVEAMVSRQGEVFDQARSRVGTQQGVRWLFSAFLADLYPEGEKTQRQNADEYYQAIEKWTSGDTDAMQKFYDEHPDYEARMAALRDPQERLKSYLISEVWDRWNEADRVTKKAAAEQLGDMFNQAFLDKETRSYDAIDTETLAYWAKMLGGDMIEGTPTVPEGTALHVPPPELRQEVESFYTERDAKIPQHWRLDWCITGNRNDRADCGSVL